MAKEQELTPEEKLLEVIQKGDTAPQGVSSDATGDALIGDGQDTAVVTKRGATGDSPVSLKVINRILVLVALVAIGFSAYEIYGNMPKEGSVFAETELDLTTEDQTALVASLSDTLDMFHTTRITGIPPNPRPVPKDEFGEILEGWRAYVRDNFKMLALSKVMKAGTGANGEIVDEAIVMDTKLKKMLFLQVGQDIMITDKKVRVDKISEKTVEFACEDDCQIIGDTGKK